MSKLRTNTIENSDALGDVKVNRNTTDGDLITLQRDEVSMASIGVTANDLTLTSGSTVTRLEPDGGIKRGNYYAIKPLPYFYFGSSSITDEYLIIAEKYESTLIAASGISGTIRSSRGSGGSGNAIGHIEFNFQSAYNANVCAWFRSIGPSPRFTRVDEITVDGVAYYALRGVTSGGQADNFLSFEGHVLNNNPNSDKILTRVRESDANVTFVQTYAWPERVEYNRTLNDGTITQHTNIRFADGAGVDFGAVAGGGASASVLSDYEEGTWTPTMYGSSVAGTTTYSVQQGFYTKIGNRVTAHCYVSHSGATGTGDMRIGNLPFTSKAGTYNLPTGALYIDNFALGSGYSPNNLIVNQNSIFATGYQYSQSAANAIPIPMPTVSGTTVLCTLMYETA